MNVQVINPLTDNRWDDLVARHPRASVFHQRGWLEALSRTYGYEPMALTSALPGQALQDGVVFCRVASWLTGTRLVSLPFADHCEPLLNDAGDYQGCADWLKAECDHRKWKYVEMRPLSPLPVAGAVLTRSQSYCLHELDTTPSLEYLFRHLHKDSIQRRIRRADRERFSYEVGVSQSLLEDFYSLVRITRKRQVLPPQPLSWFTNLVAAMGDGLQIRLLRKQEIPIAGILTLRHGSTMVYKYGGSDERFHHFGVMPLLFWRLIEESKALGLDCVDFGRSDLDRNSLIAFKDKFGTSRRLLLYYRYDHQGQSKPGWATNSAMRHLCSHLPNSVLATGGRLLYRHMG